MARGAHKVNPIGFRVGVNKNWKSIWYAGKDDYAKKLLEDIKIKKLIEKRLKSAGVADITIKRFSSKTVVEISVARPGVVIGRGGAGISKLKEDLAKTTNQEIEIKIFEIKNPEIVAKLVAEAVAEQCEKRVNPKIAMAKAVESAKQSKLIKGIDIWVAGRIKNAEIARREKVKWGTIPRHTLRADIDYHFTEAQVPGAGKHGIKVWIYKGEKNNYSID